MPLPEGFVLLWRCRNVPSGYQVRYRYQKIRSIGFHLAVVCVYVSTSPTWQVGTLLKSAWPTARYKCVVDRSPCILLLFALVVTHGADE
jgi:hypothetical protein